MFGKHGLLALFVAVLSLCALAAANNIGGSALGQQTIVIVGHPQLGNLTYCNCGAVGCSLEGKAVDRTQAALEKLGYKVERRCDPRKTWGDYLNETEHNRNYVIAAGFWDINRSGKFKFSVENGFYDSIVCYTNTSKHILINSVDGLNDLIGGTTANDSYGQYLNAILAKLNVKRYLRVEDCLNALARGEIDYYIASDQVDKNIAQDGWTIFTKGPEIERQYFRNLFASNTIVNVDALNTTYIQMPMAPQKG